MTEVPISTTKGKILVIDDEVEIRESLELLLTSEGYELTTAENGMQGIARLEAGGFDLVLLDLMMPDISGIQVLVEVRKKDRETPIFMLTAYGSVENAVQALKAGATDYFTKPWDNEKLLLEIARTMERGRLERENVELKRALRERYSFPNIVGKSERIHNILDLVSQVAPSRSTIMITGETGTGKELIAKAIHGASPRADNMFIAVNSGGLPQDLLESTLFGHVKGAFTGAVRTQKGYFEIANNGTIFFDEVGNISLETQGKLLRVIQEREFMPLGSSEVVRVDVRILAATNSDLRRLVEEGRFREDLYYRLNVINLVLPPLRERKEDIPLLVEHFFTKYCRENEKFLGAERRSELRFAPEALQVMMDHNWPGNVRELENAIERSVVLATQEQVPIDVLPDAVLHASGIRIRRDAAGALPSDASLFEVVADFERRKIIDQLEACGYSQTEASEALRIPLSTLNQKIKRLEIQVKKKSDLAKAEKQR